MQAVVAEARAPTGEATCQQEHGNTQRVVGVVRLAVEWVAQCTEEIKARAIGQYRSSPARRKVRALSQVREQLLHAVSLSSDNPPTEVRRGAAWCRILRLSVGMGREDMQAEEKFPIASSRSRPTRSPRAISQRSRTAKAISLRRHTVSQ